MRTGAPVHGVVLLDRSTRLDRKDANALGLSHDLYSLSSMLLFLLSAGLHCAYLVTRAS